LCGSRSWAATTALYNWPRNWVQRGRPGVDLLNQAAYLLVFILSSWNQWAAAGRRGSTFVISERSSPCNSHLFGEIMDLGARTRPPVGAAHDGGHLSGRTSVQRDNGGPFSVSKHSCVAGPPMNPWIAPSSSSEADSSS